MRESSTIHRRIVTRIHNVPSDISIFLQSSFQTSVKLILALSLLTFTRDRPRSIICAPIRVCLRTFIVRRSFFIVCWEVIVSSSQAWLYLSTIYILYSRQYQLLRDEVTEIYTRVASWDPNEKTTEWNCHPLNKRCGREQTRRFNARWMNDVAEESKMVTRSTSKRDDQVSTLRDISTDRRWCARATAAKCRKLNTATHASVRPFATIK